METKKIKEKEFEIPYKIKLQTPIEWGTETIREITIKRRLKARDLKSVPVQNIQMDHVLSLVSKMTGEPVALIEELDVMDLMQAAEVLNSFLPAGLGIGESL